MELNFGKDQALQQISSDYIQRTMENIKSTIFKSLNYFQEESSQKQRLSSSDLGQILFDSSQLFSFINQETYTCQKNLARKVFSKIIDQFIEFIDDRLLQPNKLDLVDYNKLQDDLTLFASRMNIAYKWLGKSELLQIKYENPQSIALQVTNLMIWEEPKVRATLLDDFLKRINGFILNGEQNRDQEASIIIKSLKNFSKVEQSPKITEKKASQSSSIHLELSSLYKKSHSQLIDILINEIAKISHVDWIARAAYIYHRCQLSHKFLEDGDQVKNNYRQSLESNFLMELKKKIVENKQIQDVLNKSWEDWSDSQRDYIAYLVQIFQNSNHMVQLSQDMKSQLLIQADRVSQTYSSQKLMHYEFKQSSSVINLLNKFIKSLQSLISGAQIILMRDMIREVITYLFQLINKEGFDLCKQIMKLIKRSLKRSDFQYIMKNDIITILKYLEDLPVYFSSFFYQSTVNFIRGRYEVSNMNYLCETLDQHFRCVAEVDDYKRLIEDLQSKQQSDLLILFQTNFINQFTPISEKNSDEQILKQYVGSTKRSFIDKFPHQKLEIAFEFSTLQVAYKSPSHQVISISMSISQFAVIRLIEKKGVVQLKEIEQEFVGINSSNILFDLRQFEKILLLQNIDGKYSIDQNYEGFNNRKILVLKPYSPKKTIQISSPDQETILKTKIVKCLKNYKRASFQEIHQYVSNSVKFMFVKDTLKGMLEKLISDTFISRDDSNPSIFIYT